MILVDTSIWILHLRSVGSGLGSLLSEGTVMCHPFIIGELACGRIANRSEILSLLGALPMPLVAEPSEVLSFIENHHLMGRGIGFVDANLLASAAITGVPMWTSDRKLRTIAKELGLGYAR